MTTTPITVPKESLEKVLRREERQEIPCQALCKVVDKLGLLKPIAIILAAFVMSTRADASATEVVKKKKKIGNKAINYRGNLFHVPTKIYVVH